LKISKEIITGVITIAAIGLLVAGVNFLKGNSFFGGDQVYYAYLPNSGGVTPATSVMVNGVVIGKVLEVELTGETDSLKKVLVKFNIQDENFKITKGSRVEAGAIDMFTKGLTLTLNPDISAGYYAVNSKISGIVTVDLTSQVKEYADPISQKVQAMMSSIDKMVNGLSSFWDTTASSEMEQSMKEVKIAIKKFGNAANEIEGLVVDERIKLSRIMTNVEAITLNLKKSNDTVKAIIGNVKTVTDQLVTADFVSVIENAKNTLKSVNAALESANKGEGTLGKLLSDETLYNGLVATNKQLENLVNDIQVHPERYIHFSVLGAKTKGAPLTNKEEVKLKEFLNTLPDK